MTMLIRRYYFLHDGRERDHPRTVSSSLLARCAAPAGPDRNFGNPQCPQPGREEPALKLMWRCVRSPAVFGANRMSVDDGKAKYPRAMRVAPVPNGKSSTRASVDAIPRLLR